MNEETQTEITTIIKDDYDSFGCPIFNAMSIMEKYIFDNPGNVHLKVEEIQNIYFELRNAKQGIVSALESCLRGAKVVTPASTDEETGEVTPAVYYAVTTEEDLLTQAEDSNSWTVAEVYAELKGDMTWNDLK